MSTNKVEKAAEVKALHERFAKATAVVVSNYQGMDVESVTKLRKSLFKAKIDYFVAKNTLTCMAIEKTPFASLAQHFTGVNSIGMIYDDPTALAKIFQNFAKDEERLKIRFGFLAQGEKMLTPAEVKVLAELPSRDQLLAQLVHVLKSQPSALVMSLNDMLGKFVRTLSAIHEKKAKA